MEIGGRVREIDREIFPLVSRSIGVDTGGRIWVITYREEVPRDLSGEEFILQRYLQFEVFDPDGILLARLPFPEDIERYDNMTMCGDHIYFVDPYGQACVFKYRVFWRD